MARRVFLHIGVPKSGTTFLQTAMWHNRKRLRRQRFLYPGANRMEHYHASRVVRDVPVERLGTHAASWDNLVDAVSRWRGSGLISHEFFCLATAAQARRAVEALAPAEVHVVVTARDYVRQLPAVWQESLKMNSSLSLDEFMAAMLGGGPSRGAWSWNSQDLPAILERWSEAVPRERLHVVTVPPPGAPRQLLWERWCAVLGVDATDFDMDLPFANESLGAPQAALMHRLKPHLTGPLTRGPVRHRWVRAYFGHQVLVPQAGDRFGVRTSDGEALVERSRLAAQRIEEGGYPVTGDLADLVPTELPQARNPGDVEDDEVVEVAVQAIDQLIRDVRALTTERDRWRSRATSGSRGAATPWRSGLRGRARRLRRRLAS